MRSDERLEIEFEGGDGHVDPEGLEDGGVHDAEDADSPVVHIHLRLPAGEERRVCVGGGGLGRILGRKFFTLIDDTPSFPL